MKDGLGQNTESNYYTKTDAQNDFNWAKGTRKSIGDTSKLWYNSNRPEVGNKEVRDVIPKEMRRGKSPGIRSPFYSQITKLA